LLVWCWNRFFTPVPARIALSLWLLVAIYEAPALFTSRVDLPANLAFVAFPWQATGQQPATANTGIVFTQIAPWSHVARETLLAGEIPFWNRHSASGAPLLANQQTAIFHPFTLIGLLLSIGKAFSLSAALRLYCVSFFTFIFLRQQMIGTLGAVFGAVAFTFCSFHIVWLLFPLGLATMMLAPCLVGTHEVVQQPRPASYLLLVSALGCAILGGHPESALWVWIASAIYAIFATLSRSGTVVQRVRLLAVAASAFLLAMLLTAFFWLPTLRVLQYTSRYEAMQSKIANPARHGLSYEWLLPLVTPNILGTPVEGTYVQPRGSHPAVLNDYGEVASGYAGLITLALAFAAPFAVRRRRGTIFAFILMVFALLTIAEAPIWRDVLRAIPLVGISLHQRLRVLWALGACMAAAFALDSVVEGARPRSAAVALLVAVVCVLSIYLVRHPAFVLTSKLALSQLLVPVLTAVTLAGILLFGVRRPTIAVALVFLDLVIATYKYNPPARPQDVYPVTGAIRTLQLARRPYRMAAAGWSLLADTPSYYDIEDIKTTDPVQHARYMRLLKGYLRIPADSYDLLIQDYGQPFFDYLNVRFIYVPPNQSVNESRFILRYHGPDGVILENLKALPRYFLVGECTVEPDFDRTVGRLKTIRDFRSGAIVDQIPNTIRKMGLEAGGGSILLSQGDVHLVSYTANETDLTIKNASWALLASSDVNWPGWRAYINGRRLPPVTVNGAFLGCFIPPGGGRVVLRYRPDEYDFGLKLAAVGLILGGFAIFVLRRLVRR
jgi:hypothetical protein